MAHAPGRLCEYSARHAARVDAAVRSVADRAVTMGNRAGAAFVAMGSPQSTNVVGSQPRLAISGGKLADASSEGDFQLVPSIAGGIAERVSNLVLPLRARAVRPARWRRRAIRRQYVSGAQPEHDRAVPLHHDRGRSWRRCGCALPCASLREFPGRRRRDAGLGVCGKAVSLTAGVYFQAPPRNLHGFRLNQAYNRFAAFLSPGIFEPFFTRGGRGQNGVGRQAQPEAAAEDAARADRRRVRQRRRAPEAARGGPGSNDMFRTLMMSGRGPDGYPLDVHGPTLPLPPQDPIWMQGRDGAIAERAALLAHALAICGATHTQPRDHAGAQARPVAEAARGAIYLASESLKSKFEV